MNACRWTISLLAGLVLVFDAPIAHAEPTLIARNPFARPPSTVAADSNGDSPRGERVAQALDLRATMVAANNRLADVAGQILRPGDAVQGFTLLHVFEDRAVFESQGRELTIYVKPELVGNNE